MPVSLGFQMILTIQRMEIWPQSPDLRALEPEEGGADFASPAWGRMRLDDDSLECAAREQLAPEQDHFLKGLTPQPPAPPLLLPRKELTGDQWAHSPP